MHGSAKVHITPEAGAAMLIAFLEELPLLARNPDDPYPHRDDVVQWAVDKFALGLLTEYHKRRGGPSGGAEENKAMPV
jgi:hypothetical protein